MQMNIAFVREQGVNFVVVVVKPTVLNNPAERTQVQGAVRLRYPGHPVILMAQNYRGEARYYGRNDIVNFLSNIPWQALPWKRLTIN